MQVDVHGVHAQIAGPDLAGDGVEVGAVAVEIGACRMHGIGNLLHFTFKQAAGVGIGQHDRRHIRAELGLQGFGIDMAVGLGGHLVHGEAGKGGGGRIGAMGGFRHQNALAVFAPGANCGADRQQAAQFAMRASLGRHGHRRHAGERGQPVHQLGDQPPARLASVDCGASGCRSPKPGSRAIFSFRRGLCFMVQEPSG